MASWMFGLVVFTGVLSMQMVVFSKDTAVLCPGDGVVMPVVVSHTVDAATREHAQALADMLGKITGQVFEVETGNGQSGIAVGVGDDFAALPFALPDDWRPDTVEQRERYRLRSHDAGLCVIGTTSLAVENGVWDLLYRLGYRHFFPGATWEVIPHHPVLSLAVDVDERPDYLHRHLWYGYGRTDYNDAAFTQWRKHNRMQLGFELNTYHVYNDVVEHFADTFQEKTALFSLVDGKRFTIDDARNNVSFKFCIANRQLRQLVVDYALHFLREHPQADSVSVDPSDGGGWCECESCQQIGSVSDQAVFLANTVAEAVEKQFPEKYVAMYAYHQHSPPPSLQVHPRVIVSVATAFIRGGYTVDQLLEQWATRGVKQFGIREYYSIMPWDHDLPGQSHAGDPKYLTRTIPHFHRQGARHITMEAGDNWGAYGLGYYLASRLQWKIDQADQVDVLTDDFLTRAFASAKAPMADFYQLLDGAHRPLLTDDLVGRMYRALDTASQLNTDEMVQARLDDLILYTRYVELYKTYTSAPDDQVQAAFETLVRHVYRMRKTMMVHAKGFVRDQYTRDQRVTLPEVNRWGADDAGNTWKSDVPFKRSELNGFVKSGIQNNALLGFTPVSFSADLKPARMKKTSAPVGALSPYGRFNYQYLVYLKANQPLPLTVTGGVIEQYRDLGDVRVALETIGDAIDKVVDRAEVKPDGKPHKIVLRSGFKGLHRVLIADEGSMSQVQWPKRASVVCEASSHQPATLYAGSELYFYVPQDTTVIGGYTSSPGLLVPSGADPIAVETGHFAVPVPKAQRGTYWRVKVTSSFGSWQLLTVPPYLARTPDQLLLPVDAK